MKQITEGKATIHINAKDIATKQQEVFYNPNMELNRTLSILLLSALKRKQQKILLPLAGTGIRGIRFTKELPKKTIDILHMNDVNSQAVKYIQHNLKLNNLEKNKHIIISNDDANKLLANTEEGFDYIDIDPFGSPNFLLDNAIRRLKNNSILAVTATDTAPLAGTYPATSKIKYWATTSNVPAKHELGLRILARKIQLMGMHQEKGLRVLFSYHYQHYYRIYFFCERGKKVCAEQYPKLTMMHNYCNTCGHFEVNENMLKNCLVCKATTIKHTGPLYAGPLQDNILLKKMKKLPTTKTITTLLDNLIAEAKINMAGHYDFHDLASKHKTQINKFEVYTKKLGKYLLARSTTNKYGFKTNAPTKEVYALFKK
ncbi:methyltransferase [Candidatus Woesearchaeota archaeon]|nr:methyltransferase [Candidatus Woesearchaeota archaeon]